MQRRHAGSMRGPGLIEAIRRILQPLARVAADEGVPRDVFVAAARDAFRANTNGNRRFARAAGGTPPVDYEAALRVIGHWLSTTPFATGGRPRPLPLRGRGSFAELAQQAGVNASAMLAQLRRVGAVRIVRGRVALIGAAYLPAKGVAEKLDILGRDTAEFIETVMHNLSASASHARLQRKASYDNIGSAGIPAVRERLRELAMQALRDANTTLATVDRDRNPRAPGGRRTRMSFGVYVAEEPVGPPRRVKRTLR